MKVIKFYSTTCQPCKTLSDMLQKLTIDEEVDSVCIDTNTNPAREYRIRAVPTLLILDNNGVEVARESKFQTQTMLENFLQKNNVSFSTN